MTPKGLRAHIAAEDLSIDGPSERAEAVVAGNTSWPEGWYGVSDGNDGYIAYFQHASDADGFLEWLRAAIIQGGRNESRTAKRYCR